MCRVLGVSEQGYYRFLHRPEKGAKDRELLTQIYECLREDAENGENYGVRRIIAWLRLHRGYSGGDRKIYQICKQNHLTIHCKRSSHSVTKVDRQAEKSENLIKQDFTTAKPNQKFLTDITEIPCSDGKLYLTAVLDCFDGMRTELCVKALENACRGTKTAGTFLHPTAVVSSSAGSSELRSNDINSSRA